MFQWSRNTLASTALSHFIEKSLLQFDLLPDFGIHPQSKQRWNTKRRALANCLHVRGACNTWALEPADRQTVALLLQMLPPDLRAILGKVRALGLKSLHFSPPCTKLACLPRDSLFAVCAPSPLYITWLWKSHLAPFKVLYSSRAAVKTNGYKPPWNLRSL